MISSVYIVSADNERLKIIKKTSKENNTIEIKVAIYDDTLNIYNDKDSGGGKYLIFPIRDYEWKVGNISYSYKIEVLSTKNILNGELNKNDYDIFIYSWEQLDTNLFFTGLSKLPRNSIRVNEIRKFVENGGGYYASCGGSTVAGDMINEPETYFESLLKKSCLKISCLNIEFHSSKIISSIFPNIESSLSEHAYIEYSGYKLDPSENTYSGIPTICNISKNNPIFDDLIENNRRINWIGAPPYIMPEIPDREIMILARFPDIEFSKNVTTKINHWKFIGGLPSLIKEFFTPHNTDYWNNKLGRFMNAWVFSKDWVDTGKVVETNISNKPFMTAEIYPNMHKARIVRCSGHPEFAVIWGGHIENEDDHEENTMYEGFYKWVNVTPAKDTIEDEKTYNYWIIRRSIAWASKKVPDNNLPSIYGPSQVCDIYPYEQPSNFKILGNAEISDGLESLELYYRYSIDNGTTVPWSEWSLLCIDEDGSDGWSWEFNSPDGPGYYQFYSIRNVRYGYEWLYETSPPGPDAVVKIVD
jgi:hypothetical protein